MYVFVQHDSTPAQHPLTEVAVQRTFAIQAHRMPVSLKQPTQPRPTVTQPHKSVDWFPYPMKGPRVTYHEDCYFNSYCDLAIVMSDLIPALAPVDGTHHFTAARDERLNNVLWDIDSHRAALPICVQVQPDSSPHIFNLS